MSIELNPDLNVAALAAQLQEKKRLRIANILTAESAEYILDNLKNATAWHLVHSRLGTAPKVYSPDELTTFSESELESIYTDVRSNAATSYQFVYKFFPIIDAIQAGNLPESSMLFQLASFLNGTEFLRFARNLTGNHSLVKIDPQASLYECGHFLNTHDDTNDNRSDPDGSIRRFAIVMGFTKNWSPNWGGQTMFYPDTTPDTAESWNPAFNSLTIFEVPVLHSVNYVAPFAPEGRYAVTGWLREQAGLSRPDLGDS